MAYKYGGIAVHLAEAAKAAPDVAAASITRAKNIPLLKRISRSLANMDAAAEADKPALLAVALKDVATLGVVYAAAKAAIEAAAAGHGLVTPDAKAKADADALALADAEAKAKASAEAEEKAKTDSDKNKTK